MPYLLSISLGPVQEFIFRSRKTRDLWLGSRLLSEATRAAAGVFRAPTGTLIFPTEDTLKSDTPIANKILAIVSNGNPAALAVSAENAAQLVVQKYFDEAMKELTKRGGAGYVDPVLAQRQIDGFLEWSAAWSPYEPHNADLSVTDPAYEEARRRGNVLLASRKALRDFTQEKGEPGTAKSSLNPNLETVFRINGSPVSWRNQLPLPPQRVRSALRVKGAEQLDAISLVKRHAYQQRFPSISRVTIDPFIRRLACEPDGKTKLRTLVGLADAIGDTPAVELFFAEPGSRLGHYSDFSYDSQLFYDDGSRDVELDPTQQERAKDFYKHVHTWREELDIPELPTYVATVAADGDRMGEAIDSLRTIGQHQDFSRALARFADRAADVTAKHNGALVFSGGDDVLAFAPLDTVLDYVEELRNDFARIVGKAAGGIEVSLSVGVAIAHYSDNLQELLGWARDAEQAAKQAGSGDHKKNALAVALYTRGGDDEPRTVVRQWRTKPVPDRWQVWVDWHRRDLIPDGAAYELQTLDRELRSLWDKNQLDIAELRRQEVFRILNRKHVSGGTKKMDEKQQRAKLMDLVRGEKDDLRRLVDELIIARRIAAATDVAHGRLEQEG